MLFFFFNTRFMIDSYVNQVQLLPCLCQLLLKVVNWICHTFYMDLSKLLHVFVKLKTCISRPLPNKTKLKFDKDFEAC